MRKATCLRKWLFICPVAIHTNPGRPLVASGALRFPFLAELPSSCFHLAIPAPLCGLSLLSSSDLRWLSSAACLVCKLPLFHSGWNRAPWSPTSCTRIPHPSLGFVTEAALWSSRSGCNFFRFHEFPYSASTLAVSETLAWASRHQFRSLTSMSSDGLWVSVSSLEETPKLPLTLGESAPPGFLPPNQAPDGSRLRVFFLSVLRFLRLPGIASPEETFTSRFSGPNRPDSEQFTAVCATCWGYTFPCFSGETEPPDRLPSSIRTPTLQHSRVVKGWTSQPIPLTLPMTTEVAPDNAASSRTPVSCWALFQVLRGWNSPAYSVCRLPLYLRSTVRLLFACRSVFSNRLLSRSTPYAVGGPLSMGSC